MTRCEAFDALQATLEDVHIALLCCGGSTAERITTAHNLRAELSKAIFDYRDAAIADVAREVRYARQLAREVRYALPSG